MWNKLKMWIKRYFVIVGTADTYDGPEDAEQYRQAFVRGQFGNYE